MDLAEFRSQFPALRTRAYLFAGALTPAAKPVRAAWDDWTDSWQYDPNFVYTGPMMTGRMDELRTAFGRLIGGDPASGSLTDNTTRAANMFRCSLTRGGVGTQPSASTSISSPNLVAAARNE